jgi:hypothetical protein
MAAIDFTIKATSLTDLETTIASLHKRFQLSGVGEPTGPGVSQGQAAAPKARAGGRPGANRAGVATAAHSTPAEQAPPQGDDAEDGHEDGPDMAEPVVGDGASAPVVSGEADEVQVEEATLEDVKKAAQALSKTTGQGVKGVQDTLAAFGVDKFPKIPEAQYRNVIRAMSLKQAGDDAGFASFITSLNQGA